MDAHILRRRFISMGSTPRCASAVWSSKLLQQLQECGLRLRRHRNGRYTYVKIKSLGVWKSNKIKELWRARSLLYQRRFLRPNSHFSAFFEIYKIQNPLHRSKPKFSQNFTKPFFNFLSNFENFLSRECLILAGKMFNFSFCKCLILRLIFK